MRTAASLVGHPAHTMLVHFPVAFLAGGFGLDVANRLLGDVVPTSVPGYLLILGLAAGLISAVPGVVDFLVTVRPRGGEPAANTIRHAICSLLALILFAAAWRLRGGAGAAPSTAALLTEAAGVVMLALGSFLGGSLVLKDHVGPHP